MKGRSLALFRIACPVTLLSILSVTVPARAGCPTTCDAVVSKEPLLAPALDCLEFNATAGSCECNTRIEVHSTCTRNVSAVGFTFLRCSPDLSTNTSDIVWDTDLIKPAHSCFREDPLRGNGTTDFEYHFDQDGTDHTLTYQVEVKNFDGSPSVFCSTPKRSTQAGSDVVSVTILCIGAIAVMRHRRQRNIKHL
jgi:hypothetical protein